MFNLLSSNGALSSSGLDKAARALQHLLPEARPQCGIVLGSGWDEAAADFTTLAEVPYSKIPGLGKTGAPGHAGRLAHARLDETEVLIFHGRRHFYEGAGWLPVILPVWLMKTCGATRVLLTNAAGAIRHDLEPGALMAVSDHINCIGANPLTGPHLKELGERFPDQSEIYSRALRKKLRAAGTEAEGVYAAMSGPSFETPAEINLLRICGADAVGMSTVPEALVANAIGLEVAALSCTCNWAAGISPMKLSGADVMEAARKALPHMRSVLTGFIRSLNDAAE